MLRSPSKIFVLTLFDGKCQNLQSTHTTFQLALNVSEVIDNKIFNFLSSKSRSRSQSTIFAVTPFDGPIAKSTNDSRTFLS